MDKLGTYAMPTAAVLIVLFCLVRKVPVFDAFTDGAKQGLRSAISILPTLVGLMTGVAMLQASGALELMSKALAPLMNAVGLPAAVAPLVLMKPVSGSGSTAVLTQILQQCGADSFAGRVAAVLSGSTETLFYCIAVYYGSIKVHRTRHTLPAAFFGDCVACVVAPLAVRFVFHMV
ncbi:MAG: spore maturation protein [Oscillospiraceae bacterium]|nr:spore maturation protein [Oscillospiraceae bacterium]